MEHVIKHLQEHRDLMAREGKTAYADGVVAGCNFALDLIRLGTHLDQMEAIK